MKRGNLMPAGKLNGKPIVSRDLRILSEGEFLLIFEIYALDKVSEGRRWQRH